MNSKFLDWYTQALGATFGMMACIYAYLNGFMFVYGNIDRNFDFLRFEGVIASYLLYPLCILTLILAVIKSYIQRKTIFNFSFEGLNTIVIILTIALGFMGAKIYFIIPTLFILCSPIKRYIFNTNVKSLSHEGTNNPINEPDTHNPDEDIIIEGKIIKKNMDLLLTKREMARDLLTKDASIQFISEITGLSLEDINNLEEKSHEQ